MTEQHVTRRTFLGLGATAAATVAAVMLGGLWLWGRVARGWRRARYVPGGAQRPFTRPAPAMPSRGMAATGHVYPVPDGYLEDLAAASRGARPTWSPLRTVASASLGPSGTDLPG